MQTSYMKEGSTYELKYFGLCKLGKIADGKYYFCRIHNSASICLSTEEVEVFMSQTNEPENTISTSSIGNHDSVQKPKHYMLIPDQYIEVRDVCKAMSEKISSKGYSAMLVSDYVQMLQYLLRWQDKNGLEDLEKAEWYLKQIIKSLK